MEQSIPSKNGFSSGVFHEEAYAILCMTWGVDCLDSYVSNFESLSILRCFGDALAVFPSDNWSALELGVGELEENVRTFWSIEKCGAILPWYCCLLRGHHG